MFMKIVGDRNAAKSINLKKKLVGRSMPNELN